MLICHRWPFVEAFRIFCLKFLKFKIFCLWFILHVSLFKDFPHTAFRLAFARSIRYLLFCSPFFTLCGVSGQAAQPFPLAALKLSMTVYGRKLDVLSSTRTTKTAHSAVLRKGR